jgi:hypothetical protein
MGMRRPDYPGTQFSATPRSSVLDPPDALDDYGGGGGSGQPASLRLAPSSEANLEASQHQLRELAGAGGAVVAQEESRERSSSLVPADTATKEAAAEGEKKDAEDKRGECAKCFDSIWANEFARADCSIRWTSNLVITIVLDVVVVIILIIVLTYLTNRGLNVTFLIGGNGTDVDAPFVSDNVVCLGGLCNITLSLPRDAFEPVVIMYGFSSFNQNYNSYYTSVVFFQALGTQLGISSEADLVRVGSTAVYADEGNTTGPQFYPAGLYTKTFYNDTISMSPAMQAAACDFASQPVPAGTSTQEYSPGFFVSGVNDVLERPGAGAGGQAFDCAAITHQGISWAALPGLKYKNPEGYPAVLAENSLVSMAERYPCCVNETLNIEDERVVNWYQPAAFGDFNKIYGVIPYGLPAGNHTLQVVRRAGVLRGELRLKVLAGPAVGDFYHGIIVIVTAIMVGLNSLTIVVFPVKHILCPRFGDTQHMCCRKRKKQRRQKSKTPKTPVLSSAQLPVASEPEMGVHGGVQVGIEDGGTRDEV